MYVVKLKHSVIWFIIKQYIAIKITEKASTQLWGYVVFENFNKWYGFPP